MSRHTYAAGAAALAFATTLFASANSAAHIDLTSPTPRVGGIPDTYLKTGPCGQQTNGRVEERASVFRPGETITLTWSEYIEHPSYYRIAFDADGDDSFTDRDPTGIDVDADDPTELEPGPDEIILDYILDKQNGVQNQFSVEVTLPDVECDNCTLQIIQFMYGSSPTRSTYYQCVDLVLTNDAPDAGGGGPDVIGEGGSANAGVGGSAMAAGGAPAAGGAGGAGTAGSDDMLTGEAGAPLAAAGAPSSGDATGDVSPVAESDVEDDDGGCSVAVAPRPSSFAALGAFGLIALGALYRRRRAR